MRSYWMNLMYLPLSACTNRQMHRGGSLPCIVSGFRGAMTRVRKCDLTIPRLDFDACLGRTDHNRLVRPPFVYSVPFKQVGSGIPGKH
jgi:hypothetical protein